jgi:uncharacterized iron-regulated protein
VGRVNMKKVILGLSLAWSLAHTAWAVADDRLLTYRVYDVRQEREVALGELMDDLKKKRFVLVGEHHSEERHHMAQLMVIRALHESGAKVAVGMEMFRRDSQRDLDRWVSGELSEAAFQRRYYENWDFPWPMYSGILHYVRENRIPLIGLNVPPEITRQVARGGFESLSEAQKGRLPNVTCTVDRQYMDYVKRAYGAHAHGHMNFTHFCEAQLVWDKAMAMHALDYIRKNPDRIMVLLTGIGHAWKWAIPTQIRKRSEVQLAVIMPEVPDSAEPGTISGEDADYILMDVDRSNPTNLR